MGEAKRPMPTRPGAWWRAFGNKRLAVDVWLDDRGNLRADSDRDGRLNYNPIIPDDGRWICEIPTPERIAALEACAAALSLWNDYVLALMRVQNPENMGTLVKADELDAKFEAAEDAMIDALRKRSES